jgi:hypothetical protein
VGPPSFDDLLDVICRRLVGPQPAGQRPATLAVLAAAVGALARAGRTVLLAIDHADHLTNNVIAEVTRLGEYLDASPASFVCIFIGSPTLASRLDAARRQPGAAQRVPEIRVSHPSGDELAALLAYEDTAQPGGPILTPGAIDRISVYAKANLHWAAPLADAARTLAANQGEREVTPELVRGALLELWPPEQAQPSDITRLTPNPVASASNPDSATMTPPGMSDVPLGSLYGADASVPPVSPSAADPASSLTLPPSSPAESTTSGAAISSTISIRRPGALRIAIAVAVLLLIIGIVAFALRDAPDHIGQQPPGSEQTESRLPTPQPPGPQGEGEAKRPEQQQNQTSPVPPAEPVPSDAEPSRPAGADYGQTAGSASDQPAETVPASPDIAPATPPLAGAPAPAPRAPTTKKPPAPKATKQDHRQVPSHPWIQTR